MKNTPLLALLTISVIALHLPVASAKDAPVSAEQLKSELESALKSRNTNAVLSLFNWQGVPEDNKAGQTDMICDLVGGTFTNKIRLAPVKNPQAVDYESDGFHCFPNIAIVGTMEIDVFIHTEKSSQLETFPLLYGKTNGCFYFPGYRKETISGPALRTFSVFVDGDGDHTSTNNAFTGSCVFVKHGKEIEKPFSGQAGLNTFVQCDFIKSCKVKKASNKQKWIKLEIRDGGTKIFESRIVTNDDAVIYEKK